MATNPNDRLTKRRLFLQRYITQLQNEVLDLNKAGDKSLIDLVRNYIEGATARELKAFANLRKTHPSSKAVLDEINAIIKGQVLSISAHLTESMDDLVVREGKYTAAALGNTLVSMRGVASQPVGGQLLDDMVSGMYAGYHKRLMSEISQAVIAEPDKVIPIIRGAAPQQRRDGVFYWRDTNLIKPNIDVVVNGGASNAANKVFEAYKVEYVNISTALDFRVCLKCRVVADGNPYLLGSAPRLPIHNRCRCHSTVHFEGEASRRPYLADERSLKDIPKDERDAITGQTRLTTEEWFARFMSDADMKAYLGPSRYELMKSGKVKSVKDLVNAANLDPLRLDQLPD